MLPMLQDVINCISQLGKADSQPELLTFYDCQGNAVGDVAALSSADAPVEIVEVPINEQVNLDDLTIKVNPIN